MSTHNLMHPLIMDDIGSPRIAAEQAYTMSAFDYVRAPVGCRDWVLFFRGWLAGRAYAKFEQSGESGITTNTGVKP